MDSATDGLAGKDPSLFFRHALFRDPPFCIMVFVMVLSTYSRWVSYHRHPSGAFVILAAAVTFIFLVPIIAIVQQHRRGRKWILQQLDPDPIVVELLNRSAIELIGSVTGIYVAISLALGLLGV